MYAVQSFCRFPGSLRALIRANLYLFLHLLCIEFIADALGLLGGIDDAVALQSMPIL